MEDLDTLNDPDLAVMCQLLGTSGVFEVKIPPRAKVAWLKNSVITELFQTGSPLSIDDIKLVYCGKVLCDADVVGMAIQKGSIAPCVVVLDGQVDACMEAVEDLTLPTIDQKSLLFAMRWLMDHGHTNPELIVKSKEVEDVVAFYRQRSDLVLTSDVLELNHVYTNQSNITTPAAPAPMLPAIPQPRWIDAYLIVRVLIGVYLFAENLPRSAQIMLGLTYYCFSTGIFLYFWRLFSRHVIKNDTPFDRPLAVAAAGVQYTGVPQIVGAVVLVPSNTGIFWDVCAFCGGLLFSLYPGWYPRTASPDIPPATESATLPMNANGPPIDAERDDENAVVDGEVMRRDGDIDVAAA